MRETHHIISGVVSAENVRLLGYFTLVLKPLTVRGETVSNTMKRKLLRISELDEKTDTYTMSAYLIVQLQLHRDLLKRAGFSYGGSFKSVQNYINETKPDGTVVTRFTPIAPYDTSDAVERLCTAYEQAIASEKVDSLILIPVFICDFLCIHPF